MHRYLQIILTFILLLAFTSGKAHPQPTISHNSMVVSSHPLATQVGLDILQRGGTAIDAAVAMGYALAVVYPDAGNLGGGGFMTIHFANGKNTFLNFREKAPLAAKKDMFLDSKSNVIPNLSLKGYLAVGVPGTVMGLNTVLQKYGTFPLKEVITPAIQLAEQGYILQEGDIQILLKGIPDFAKQPNVAAIFMKNGKSYQPGDRLVQTDLANTLKLIAQKGTDVFYKGSIADRIVKASQQNGGILSKKDFSQYTIEELNPVYCQYRGYTIISAPPPSSGGTTLCEILNIVEGYPLGSLGFHSAMSIHYLVEAMRYAYYDRNRFLGDPDFVKNPIKKLISKDYASTLRQQIQTFRATPSTNLVAPVPHEGTNTTHYAVVDHFGNAVSVTYTLNNHFGATVIAGDTGFFLNDEMDDFTAKEGTPNYFQLHQGTTNSIQPGKRPLSSMTPTIVLKNGKLAMVLGGPGGSTIITLVLQTLINVVDYGMDIKAAVDAPRIHFQWMPDSIWYEPFAISKDTEEKLAYMGYQFTPFPFSGFSEGIIVDSANHVLYGAADNRHQIAQAKGY